MCFISLRGILKLIFQQGDSGVFFVGTAVPTKSPTTTDILSHLPQMVQDWYC